MLSVFGLVIGIMALFTVIFSISFGFWIIYKSRKLNAKLLSYMGITIIFAGGALIGVSYDFITILITGYNMSNEYGIFSILSYMWVGLAFIFSMYIFVELMTPNSKKIVIVISYLVIVSYYIVLILGPVSNFNFSFPNNPGEYPLQSSAKINSPIFFIMIIGCLGYIFVLGFGFLLKAFQSEGLFRMKFFFLSVGYILYGLSALSEAIINSLISLGLFIIVVRIAFIASSIFFYIGIKEEDAEPREKRPKKEVKIEESLFRLSKKPAVITEEEVVFHREKKICLVCKEKISRIMYTCPKCDAIYCIKCSNALTDMENACWVCETPFDESKPIKLIEKEEKIDIEKIDQKKENTSKK